MSVSAAIIVKDSIRCIDRCLDSVLNAVDEIVVVDTGSTDGTLEVLERYAEKYADKVKVYNFEWVGDFSAARNYSLSKVTSSWVFVVDADDVLPEEEAPKVRQIIAEMDAKNCKAVFDIIYDNTVGGQIVHTIPEGYVRLFPSELRYKDMIHEQIVFGSMTRFQSGIHLLHDGYDSNLVDMKTKVKRNIDMLIQNLRIDPDNASLWLHLAREMNGLDNTKALRYLDIAESKTKNPDILKWIYSTREKIPTPS